MTDLHDHTCFLCRTTAIVRVSTHSQIWYACRAHTQAMFVQWRATKTAEQLQRDRERDKPEAP